MWFNVIVLKIYKEYSFLWKRYNIKVERFSVGCRKSKTKAIILANHNTLKQRNEPIRTEASASNSYLDSPLLMIG